MNITKEIELFFYLNLFCNDRCNFCFFSGLPHRENFLSLDNVKGILAEFRKENIRGIVLTGGEPTLSPSFWKIIDHVYNVYVKKNKVNIFDLSTNAITSADVTFSKKIEKYFRAFDKNHPNIKISFSFSSFKNSQEQKTIDKKIRGIRNLMSINSNVEAVVTITRDNYEHIVEMTRLLIDLCKKRKPEKYFFKIDFRLPYTSMIHQFNYSDELLVPFRDFSSVLNKALDLVRKNNICTTLHNIPLCFINNEPESFITKKPPRGIAMFPDKEKGVIKREKIFYFNKGSECNKCRLFSRCSGMENVYAKKYNYPNFKRFR